MSLTDNLVDVVDRIPTQPNRKKIVAADGTVSYATITYADEPIVPGTPINRAIFAHINTYVRNENACEIGRLAITTNPADISDQWLYCNGEDINGEQYPQLFAKSAAATPTSLTNRFKKEFEKDGGTAVSDFVELATDVEMTLCAVYGSGKFVMAGKKNSGGIELYYSESASTNVGNWQSIFLQGSETDTLLAMSFENEYFIVSALTTDNHVVLYFSKNLTAWTRKVITLRTLSNIISLSSEMNEKNSKCCKVKYINNQYVFLIPNGTISTYTSHITVYILTASELNGTWSETEVATSAGVYQSLSNIEYGGGYYFFAAGYNSGNKYVRPQIHILYATSIGGEWTKSNAITRYPCYAREADYINGLFIVNGTVADYKAGVLYTDNITNAWTSKEIFSINPSISNSDVPGLNLQLFNNMIIGVTEVREDCIIATNDNFSTVSQYQTDYFSGSSALTFHRALTVVFDDKYLLVPVNKLTKSTSGGAYAFAAGGFCIMSPKQLPTLAADGYYYYIKAKRTGDE